jgi:hypothetical protein
MYINYSRTTPAFIPVSDSVTQQVQIHEEIGTLLYQMAMKIIGDQAYARV